MCVVCVCCVCVCVCVCVVWCGVVWCVCGGGSYYRIDQLTEERS